MALVDPHGDLADSVPSFWEQEFEKWKPNYGSEAIAPIQNKVGQFLSNPIIRAIVSQARSKHDLREVRDERRTGPLRPCPGLGWSRNDLSLASVCCADVSRTRRASCPLTPTLSPRELTMTLLANGDRIDVNSPGERGQKRAASRNKRNSI